MHLKLKTGVTDVLFVVTVPSCSWQSSHRWGLSCRSQVYLFPACSNHCEPNCCSMVTYSFQPGPVRSTIQGKERTHLCNQSSLMPISWLSFICHLYDYYCSIKNFLSGLYFLLSRQGFFLSMLVVSYFSWSQSELFGGWGSISLCDLLKAKAAALVPCSRLWYMVGGNRRGIKLTYTWAGATNKAKGHKVTWCG